MPTNGEPVSFLKLCRLEHASQRTLVRKPGRFFAWKRSSTSRYSPWFTTSRCRCLVVQRLAGAKGMKAAREGCSEHACLQDFQGGGHIIGGHPTVLQLPMQVSQLIRCIPACICLPRSNIQDAADLCHNSRLHVQGKTQCVIWMHCMRQKAQLWEAFH